MQEFTKLFNNLMFMEMRFSNGSFSFEGRKRVYYQSIGMIRYAFKTNHITVKEYGILYPKLANFFISP